MSPLWVIGVGMLCVLCMVSTSKSQTELQETPFQNDQEILKEIQSLMQNIQSLLDPYLNESHSPDVNGNCRCGGLQCTCCQRIQVPKIRLNDDCCISVTYLRQNVGFLTTLKLGSKTLFSSEISLRNPIPICVGVPYLTRVASVCVHLNDLRAGRNFAHGCINFLARFAFAEIYNKRLGCFDLNFVDENQPMNAMELPYYDSPKWIETQQPFQPDENVVMMESIEQPLQN